jgi:hypothetical protein
MLVGLTNQCNLLSSLGSVLNALSLPRTAFFCWVSEVFGLCADLAGAVLRKMYDKAEWGWKRSSC